MNQQNIASLIENGKLEEAEKQLVLLESQGFVDAAFYSSMAMFLQNKRKTHEALHYFGKTLEIEPENRIALANTGLLYGNLGKKTLSEEYLRKAIQIAPNDSAICAACAGSLLALGKYDQSIDCYKKAVELNPKNVQAFSDMLLALNYSDLDSLEVSQYHFNYSTILNEDIETLPLYGHKKLRVAYLSGDFKRHSVPFFIEGLIHFHDRQKFEIYCYSDGDKEDLVTERFIELSDHWRQINDLSNEGVLQRIQKDEIDVLIDLGAHTGRRLPVFANRAAPIQVTYCGYPNTTGLKNMDFRIVDELTDPQGDKFYTEKLLRLKRCFLAFNPPDDAPEVGPLPYLKNGYITFGSFNNFTKINDRVLKSWRQLLKSVPESKLLLKSKHLNDEHLSTEVRNFFSRRGIAEERIEIHGFELKMKNHLNLYNKVDIALDTFPYNGTTTSCEALYMGVPVVTLAGGNHAGRVGVSLLSSLGLESLISDDVAGYRKLAADLAQNTELLKSLRSSMRELMFESRLCDSMNLTREIEDTIETIVKDMIHNG